MKSFLFSATNADGIKAHERIEADNLDQARYKLEVRGYHGIEFLSDENAQDIAQASRMGTGVPKPDPRWWSAEDEVQSHRRRGLAEKLWWAFRKHLPFLLPIVFWSIISIWPVRPYRWIDYVGQIATPLYCLWFVKKVMPMTLFQLILEASVWHDWARLRRLIKFARVLRRFMVTGIPDKELDFREATAFAAEGRLLVGMPEIREQIVSRGVGLNQEPSAFLDCRVLRVAVKELGSAIEPQLQRERAHDAPKEAVVGRQLKHVQAAQEQAQFLPELCHRRIGLQVV